MIVWVASFPRSGNTFFRVILKNCFGVETYSIYNDSKDISKSNSLMCLTGHVTFDASDIDTMRSSEDLFFIKTHERAPEFHASDKYVYIIRDGRNAVCSLEKYTQNYFHEHLTQRQIIDGEFLFGSWHEHVAHWSSIPKNLWTIYFENLIQNPLEITTEISLRFGLNSISHDIPTFSALHAIDSTFFNVGDRINYTQRMTPLVHNYFWFKAYDQMQACGYVQDMPEIFNDPDGKLFLQCISTESNSKFLKKQNSQDLVLLKNNLEAQCAEMQNENDALKKYTSELLITQENLNLQNTDFAALNNNLLAQSSEMKNENDTLRKANTALLADKEQLILQNSNFREINNDLQMQSSEQISKIESLRFKCTNLKTDIELLESKYNDLHVQVAMNVGEEKKFHIQCEVLKSKNLSLHSQKACIMSEFEELQTLYTELSGKNDILVNVLERVQQSVANLLATFENFVVSAEKQDAAYFELLKRANVLNVLINEERYRLQKHPLRACINAYLQNSQLQANYTVSGELIFTMETIKECFQQCSHLYDFLCSPLTLEQEGASELFDLLGKNLSLNLSESDKTCVSNPSNDFTQLFWQNVCDTWSPEDYKDAPTLVQCADNTQRLNALRILYKYPYHRLCLHLPETPVQEEWEKEAKFLEQNYVYFPFMAKGVEERSCLTVLNLGKELAGNIAFIHYVQDNSMEFLKYCIATATPVFVNRTSNVQILLGAEYPLYYYSYHDLIKTVAMRQAVLDAHQYLLHLRLVGSLIPDVIVNPSTILNFAYAKEHQFAALRHQYEVDFLRRVSKHICSLKYYQDLFILAFIFQNIPKGARILEIGGGNSRILQYFVDEYECWCVDSFDGTGNGPLILPDVNYTIVQDNIGMYSQDLPDNYFDLVFSISVMEHLPADGSTVLDVYTDINRVLKSQCYSIHTVDIFFKEQSVWICPFLANLKDVFGKLFTLPIESSALLNAKDIWFMPKEDYDLSWKQIIHEDYESFGKATAVNVLWQKDF